jgi:hypothetical protein
LGRLYAQLDFHVKAPWLPLVPQPLSTPIPTIALEGQQRLTPQEAEVSLAHTMDMLTSNLSAQVLDAATTLGRLMETDYAATAIASLRHIALAVCRILPSTLYIDCKIAAAQVLVQYGKQPEGRANVGALSTEWPVWTWMADILEAPAYVVDAIQLQRSMYLLEKPRFQNFTACVKRVFLAVAVLQSRRAAPIFRHVGRDRGGGKNCADVGIGWRLDVDDAYSCTFSSS